jgi:hypothetical protein
LQSSSGAKWEEETVKDAVTKAIADTPASQSVDLRRLPRAVAMPAPAGLGGTE